MGEQRVVSLNNEFLIVSIPGEVVYTGDFGCAGGYSTVFKKSFASVRENSSVHSPPPLLVYFVDFKFVQALFREWFVGHNSSLETVIGSAMMGHYRTGRVLHH